jgi:hypothetical protein
MWVARCAAAHSNAIAPQVRRKLPRPAKALQARRELLSYLSCATLFLRLLARLSLLNRFKRQPDGWGETG